MIFGLLSLLALSAADEVHHALYLVAFAFVVGLAALVLGISAARRARNEEASRPRGSLAGIILGMAAILLSGLALFAVVFATQLSTYEQCIQSAHGSTAQQACTRQLLREVRAREHDRG